MSKVAKINHLGYEEVYDIGVKKYHNFFANGIVVHNCMLISQLMCNFTPAESNALRRVLVKEKNPDVLENMRQKFIKGAQKKIEEGEVTEEEVIDWWDKCKSFAGYGFNKCLSPDTVVETQSGYKLLSELSIGDIIMGKNTLVEVVDVIDCGEQELYEITLESGKTIKATLNHKFLCEDEKTRELHKIINDELKIMCQ